MIAPPIEQTMDPLWSVICLPCPGKHLSREVWNHDSDQMLNEKVAAILYEVADMLELKGEDPFKPRAYRNAAHTIEEMRQDIEEVYRQAKLHEVPGVGDAIALKVAEIIDTGDLTYLKEMRNEFPPGWSS